MDVAHVVRAHHRGRHRLLQECGGADFSPGCIGNLIDRFIFGYVVDYIHVLFFPYVFNFADCCVVVGAILFAVWYLFFKDKKEAADKKVNEPTETTADGVGK